MKDNVYEFVKLISSNLNRKEANAGYISEHLSLSRSVVSQYLNQLFHEHKVIKVNTRPVLYFDVEVIQSMCDQLLVTYEYSSFEELKSMLHHEERVDFDQLIGAYGSLSSMIKQCKATLSYPPNGLPILVHGSSGSGKSRLAKLMYEYAQNQHLIDDEAKFIQVNCSEYANNPELLTANLFGSRKGAYTGADKDNLGLIALADQGILFLDEVHCLKAECQEKLFQFMDRGIYHMVGDNEKWYHAQVRLIFATTKDPEEVLLKTLLRRIPIFVELPTLDERGHSERIQLIYTMFQSEEKRIHRRIRISNLVYNALLSTSFKGNIGELENCIQAICVNALFDSHKEDQFLDVHVDTLPKFLKERVHQHYRGDQVHYNRMIRIDDLSILANSKIPIIHLYERLLNHYREFDPHTMKEDELIQTLDQQLYSYFDTLNFERKDKNITRKDYLLSILQNIFSILATRYGFIINNNDLIAIANFLYEVSNYRYDINKWIDTNESDLQVFVNHIKSTMHREYRMAQDVLQQLSSSIDEVFDLMCEPLLALIIYRFHAKKNINCRLGIIIAHGFSTASSISDAVNKCLGSYIFDAIDMPMDVTSSAIVHKLNQYLERVHHVEELILLVDMGSLEEIHKGLKQFNANIGIMNHVSTKMALEVGNYIMQGMNLFELFQKVSDNSKSAFQIVENRKKDKVIVCSCASGIGSAEKLKDIIGSSIPKNIPIKVLTCDYNQLIEHRLEDDLFKQYEVICIVGTLNPNIESIRFIPIEDLIINETFDELESYFSNYLSIEEMNLFKQNIIRSFSLSNIMNNLTILNPNKLLEHVAEAIDHLQSHRHEKYSNHVCFGLYVHICCLIERLVTRDEINDYGNLNEFIEKQKDFIQDVKDAFYEVEQYYHININVEEIGYIFDYIHNN